LRFAPASRVAHWCLAIPFLLLLTTGLLLFVPSVKAVHLGGYRLVPLIHVLSGFTLLALLLPVYALQPGAERLRRDLKRLFTPEASDLPWLRYAGYALLGAKLRPPAVGKFNAGQKLNTLATAVFTSGLLASGVVLGINYFTKRVFGAHFVESVYPFHDLFTVVAVPIIAGHIYFATLNPGTRASLRGILDGRVDAAWARLHHDRWLAEPEDSRT
jgi:formate dehydrogenase subunit gamma